MRHFAVLSIFLLSSMGSLAQDELVTDPSIAKVEFENDLVRVVRVSYTGHQKSHMHSHPERYAVTITNNDIRFYLPDGSSQLSKRAAHEAFWSEPLIHQVENASDTPMQDLEIEFKRSKGPGVEVKPSPVSTTAKGSPDDPVPVEQEPHHRLIFANQYIRVLEVIVKPGETTLFHKHSLDNIAVHLSDGQMKNQAAGEDWTAFSVKEGAVGFRAGTATPYTHRITNVGTAVFHVYDIQLVP
jgi:quercetin dioxygenase-like cupin family protein